jgi:gluconolactonase
MPHSKIIADDLQFPEGPVIDRDGSLLLVEIERRTVTRIARDGKKSTVAELDGGPNGMAWGPDGALYICNNGGFLFQKAADGGNRVKPGVPESYVGGWIERLDPHGGTQGTGERRVLYTRCGEHNLAGPNDLVFDAQGGFYFTDYGKLYPRHRINGGLYYALADGSHIVEVAYPLITPNGVGLSPDGKTVYAAETETGRLWAFDLEAPGKAKRHPVFAPHGGRILCSLPGYQRCDSLAVEENGNICIATIVSGCISVVSAEGKLIEQVPTGDVVTTNICFGGHDRKTAYITLSSGGAVMEMPWPRPGLALAYG